MLGSDLGRVYCFRKYYRGEKYKKRDVDELRRLNTVIIPNKMIYVSQKLQDLVEVAHVTNSDDDI